jgi:hypothetical protein
MRASRKSVAVSAFVFMAAVAIAQVPQAARPHPGHNTGTVRQQQTGVQPEIPYVRNNPGAQTQHRSVVDTIRQEINPCQRDYGKILYGWQDTAVQYTIESIVWWFGVLAGVAFLGLLGYIWWFKEMTADRQDCFVRAAAVLIGQRNTAYQFARGAIEKHNTLVERFNDLYSRMKVATSTVSVAGAIEAGRGATAQPQLFPEESEPAAPVLAPATSPLPMTIVEPQEITIVEKEDGGPTAEPIFVVNGVEYIKFEDHNRRVSALDRRIRTQRQTIQQLKDKLSAYES